MYPRSAVTCGLTVLIGVLLCLCLPMAGANAVSVTFFDTTDTISVDISKLPGIVTGTNTTEGVGIPGQATVSFSYTSTDPNAPTSVFTDNYNIYEPPPPPSNIEKVLPCLPVRPACFGPLSDTLQIVLTPDLSNGSLGVAITFMSDPSDELAVLTPLPGAILMAEDGTIQSIQELSDLTVSFQSDVETPLPAALPLFATGIGALGLLGWRKRKAQAVA